MAAKEIKLPKFWDRGLTEKTAHSIRAMRLTRDLLTLSPSGGPLNSAISDGIPDDYTLGYCAGRLDGKPGEWQAEIAQAARDLIPVLLRLSVERRSEVIAQGRRLAHPTSQQEAKP